MGSAVALLLNRLAYELSLFAAFGFIIGGASDLVIDLLWLTRRHWHARSGAPVSMAGLSAPAQPGPIAVFIPAWDEGAVIGDMLRRTLTIWADRSDWRLYVGTYSNDPATIEAARSVVSPRLHVVVGVGPGPTTKADCLNTLWTQMVADEADGGFKFKAVVLHDAEDLVHPDEIRLFDTMIERFDLVQVPVLPLVDRQSRWIGGHYNDEFAESHGRLLVVREALGAAVPAAGVGCAFSRQALAAIANERGAPFDADSLTEDYELGLRIVERGGNGTFVRTGASSGAGLVCVRSHFPGTLATAVRQKARWMAGISLCGWDRLGWGSGAAEIWMRLHDRRAIFAALILFAAYLSLLLTLVLKATGAFASEPVDDVFAASVAICAALLIWRLTFRAVAVARTYHWAEGLRSVPRALVGNVVAIMAAWRAVAIYRRLRRDGVVRWDKTAHRFPAE